MKMIFRRIVNGHREFISDDSKWCVEIGYFGNIVMAYKRIDFCEYHKISIDKLPESITKYHYGIKEM